MLAACAVALGLYYFQKEKIERTVVEATCTEDGYILTTELDTGTTTIEHLIAEGHAFQAWTTDAETDMQTRVCKKCGFQEQIRVSTIPEGKLPKLYLTGSLDGIGKKVKVALEADFQSEEENFQCYAITTLQGHSTFGYPKRNYTIRFYNDPQGISKHQLQFGSWNKEHKYILKANYHDQSLCRNLVGARIWSAMTASRSNLSPRIARLPSFGAVDGFPVEVYLNGDFFGLYTMNLHKDEDLYQMKDGEQSALVICNRQITDESLFRAPAIFSADYSSDWEIEYCGTLDETWAKERFNALIDFVMTSSDQEFREQLAAQMDVDAAIDYLLFIYALGMPQSGAKDLVMLSYGDVWIPSAYDMDEAFGLDTLNIRYLSPEDFLPVCKEGIWHSGTNSLLWDRLLNGFEHEIRARYAALRSEALSEEKMLALVNTFISDIPETLYDMDGNLYPNRPLADNNMQKQITDYITQRLVLLDSIFGEV